jgi:hypothetical protein
MCDLIPGLSHKLSGYQVICYQGYHMACEVVWT